MKRVHYPSILFLVTAWIFLLSFSCNASREKKISRLSADTVPTTDSLPHIVFTRSVQDAGKVVEGEKVEIRFMYYNSGAQDLLITNIETSCGCTRVSWDKTPLPHGATGYLTVVFDSHSFNGLQTKSLRVSSNSRKKDEMLAITADIIPNEKLN
ncbi:MAG: DUF1573 domain-containing protein [Bacteroidales bacterium]